MRDDEKRYKVLIHDDAKLMLYSHIQFLANVSVTAAQKMRDSLYEGFISLESMPHRCALYHTNKTSNKYRQLLVGRYQVVFSVDEKENIVHIKHILDTRQNNDF